MRFLLILVGMCSIGVACGSVFRNDTKSNKDKPLSSDEEFSCAESPDVIQVTEALSTCEMAVEKLEKQKVVIKTVVKTVEKVIPATNYCLFPDPHIDAIQTTSCGKDYLCLDHSNRATLLKNEFAYRKFVNDTKECLLRQKKAFSESR